MNIMEKKKNVYEVPTIRLIYLKSERGFCDQSNYNAYMPDPIEPDEE